LTFAGPPLILGDVDYLLESLKLSFGFPSDSLVHTDLNNVEELRSAINKNYSLLILATESKEGLINCLVEIFGRRLNLTPVIIFTLSNHTFLARQLSEERAFPEFNYCLSKELILHTSLPLNKSIGEILKTIDTFGVSYGTDDRKAFGQQVWEDVSQRLAKNYDVDHRHSMGNLMAASRILHGAVRSNDYFLDDDTVRKAQDLHEKMLGAGKDEQGNPWTNEEREDRKASFGKVIDEAKNEQRSKRLKKPDLWHLGLKKILIIDDQGEIWGPIWQFIFGDNKVDVVEDGLEGIQRIKTGHYDCTLLDIDLGKDSSGNCKTNGLEILQLIKQEQLDLPVVMMTAYDDAELTKKCLWFGAHNYFVKEITESTDRDSIQYYSKLKEIISGVPAYSSDERRVWRSYIDIEGKLISCDKRWRTTNIQRYLKRAYFLFALDNDFTLPRRLFLGREGAGYADAVLSLENALWQVANIAMAEKNRWPLETAAKYLDQPTDVDPDNVVAALAKVLKITVPSANKVRTIFNYARHGREISKDKCKTVFEAVVAVLKTQILEKFMYADDSKSISAGKIEMVLLNSRTITTANGSSHKDIGDKGAAILREGFEKTGVPQSDARVLFIDDEEDKSQWYSVLRQVFKAPTVVAKIGDTLDGSWLNQFDLVFLDLNLSTSDFNAGCTQGIDQLVKLRKHSLSLPVIMLTAINSSRYTRKALLLGASDYCPKGTTMEPAQFWEYFNTMVQRCLRWGKTEKPLWDALCKIDSFVHDVGQNEHFKEPLRAAVPSAIRKSILAPLRRSYFHYLLATRGRFLPDSASINKLLVLEAQANNLLIACGICVEGLVDLLKSTASNENKGKNVGFLTKRYFDKSCADEMDYIWHMRNKSKKAALKVDLSLHLQRTAKVALKVLNQWSIGTSYFTNEKQTYRQPDTKLVRAEITKVDRPWQRIKPAKEKGTTFGMSEENLKRLMDLKASIPRHNKNKK